MTDTNTAPKPFLSTLAREQCTESFLTVFAGCHEEPSCMFQRLETRLNELQATIAKSDSIGAFNTSGAAALEQRYCVDCENCKLGGITEKGTRACPVNALYVHAVSGTKVEPVWLGGQIVGTTYEDAHAQYCLLNDIIPDPDLPRDKQTQRLLELSDKALQSLGMDFNDVVRTWFHLDNIFDWYDTFNRVRDQFFKDRGVYDRLVPASTGVGGANSQGAAIVGNLFAVKPKNGAVTVRAVPSPLQCPAPEYGISFSRAAEVETPDHRRLFISGTASIAMGGESAYVGDIDRQVELTMDVVFAILESRGMAWSDVTRAIGYVKEKADLGAFERYCKQRDLPTGPVVVVQNDVCREDLLFELELDAMKLH
jgi:enamine deaminase RidA (YjgF/YER057c/UK114 family)